MTRTPLLALALGAALAAPVVAGDATPTRLLRFPDLHGDTVVFTYAGDLWKAPSAGGRAIRLTSHPGLELFAKISPDGESVAFTGQIDGDEQVYVMPLAGGEPRQLTFYPAEGPLAPRWGYDNQVYGWTPDGRSVLFRSMRDGFDLADTRLYTVPATGGLPTALPMPFSGAGDLSPDARQVVYSPLARDFRHWKRYEGGWAQDLYLYDLATNETRRITDNPRTERDPMWIGDRIVFASDRTGTLNLYAYDLASGDTEALTASSEWDVRWPSADHRHGRVVYELGGELEVYDLAGRRSTRIPIHVPDEGLARRPARVEVAGLIEDAGLAPKGKRAVFAARGDIFTTPIEHGPARNLSRTSGAHDRVPAWSPDGRTVAFVSDRDGEEEIWLADQAGVTPPEQLTDGHQAHFSGLAWSPDSTAIAFRDQGGRLFVVERESRRVVQVADDVSPFGLDYEWSPDSRWIALSLANPNGFRSVHVWGRRDGVLRRLHDDRFHERAVTWDPEGRYLYYLGDRDYAPQLSAWEFDYAVDRQTAVFAVALRPDVRHPFPPRSDEVELAGEGTEAGKGEKEGAKKDDGKADKKEAEKDDGKKDEPAPVEIAFEGLGSRVARLPIAAGNLFGLSAGKGRLLLLRGGSFYYGRPSPQPNEAVFYDFEERQETVIASGWNSLAFSPDGAKILVGQGGGFQLVDVSAAGAKEAKPVSTAGLEMDVVPAEEWAQIFDEVWRRFRDFFYVDTMHGYDWKALGDRYRGELASVGHRSDLNYVLSEMIAELNVSHAYVAGGDYTIPPRPRGALVGARFERDPAAGRFRISEVFAGQNEEPTYRSPLTEVGVGVAVGDYVLGIGGEELGGDDNPYRLLRHAGGGPVELRVSKTASGEGARTVLVDPIASENSLLYLAWSERNRRYVEERSGGRLGYLHIPDMGASGLAEFIKAFYPQSRRQGLVVDVRSNGGGNVSPMLLERLARRSAMVDFERNGDLPSTTPRVAFDGYLACLIDEDTASDGDQFAYMFREAGLGPLIGKRTWGGVVGIYGSRDPLIDGGAVSVPESGSASADGRWVIEGRGVDPDLVVENEPKELLAGRDQQLEKAVDVLLEKIDAEPRRLPSRPPAPVKTR